MKFEIITRDTKLMKKTTIMITVSTLIVLMGLIGCRKEGSGEKAGERMDEIIDNVKDGDAPFKKKGTMEKVGDSIDDTINGN
jgi:hypothetical protein